MYGTLEEDLEDTKGITEGVLEVDQDLFGIDEIPAVTETWEKMKEEPPGGKVSVGIRSKLFGNPESIQLEISAWKYAKTEGIDALYFIQKIYLNYLKDVPPISTVSRFGDTSVIYLNEHPTDEFTYNLEGRCCTHIEGFV